MDVMFGFVFVPGTELQILTGKLKKKLYEYSFTGGIKRNTNIEIMQRKG